MSYILLNIICLQDLLQSKSWHEIEIRIAHLALQSLKANYGRADSHQMSRSPQAFLQAEYWYGMGWFHEYTSIMKYSWKRGRIHLVKGCRFICWHTKDHGFIKHHMYFGLLTFNKDKNTVYMCHLNLSFLTYLNMFNFLHYKNTVLKYVLAALPPR